MSECFVDKIGDSNFTLESNDSLEVIEDSDESYEIIQVALPSRQILDDIIKIFYMNIQQAVYFVNIDFLKVKLLIQFMKIIVTAHQVKLPLSI